MRIYLYYKDRKQSKTFLTQIGPTILLTLDPPREVGGRVDPGNRMFENVFAKNGLFFSPYAIVPVGYTRGTPHGLFLI